jgi:hypothetical protein
MNKLMMQRSCFGFSIRKRIYDALYMNDSSSAAEQLITSSIHTGVASAKGNVSSPQPRTYQTSKLASGITVLTESVGVPSNVNLGILLNTGTRDESSETSGSMLSLKNTYMKTALNTNETVNYGIAQMSGG